MKSLLRGVLCPHPTKYMSDMKKKIILVTGGQRSGKSEFSEKLALENSETPVYLATAHVIDDEFRERVRIHQQRRGSNWSTIEEEINLSSHDMTGKTVLIDCVTMWVTNVFFNNGEDVSVSLNILKDEFDRFTSHDAVYIFVSNEIGSGGVSPNAMTRKFTDIQGWFNQHIAAHADEVYLTVAGIPLKIK